MAHVTDDKTFAFGRNWRSYLHLVDDERLDLAKRSLTNRLGSLDNKDLLDAGCGSGLFSLAATQLGASVVSIDSDIDSISCAESIRSKHGIQDSQWQIYCGSVTDRSFLKSLGSFDVVYCWGVLHHTGNMWEALDGIIDSVAPNGLLFISLYNDQGRRSIAWRNVKRIYNNGGKLVKLIITVSYVVARIALHGWRLRGPDDRGMDWWYDAIDWVGGYPFEVAMPGAVFARGKDLGLELISLETVVGHGCNQYVFAKERIGD